MLQILKKGFIISFLTLLITTVYADPWFTGPLLAPAGHTIPNGHTNLEIYDTNVFINGSFDENGNFIRSPMFSSLRGSTILTHGYTEWLDVQLTTPYLFNNTRGVHSNRLGDTSIAGGFQLLEQKKALNRIDLRLLLKETIPTGRYDNLNPLLKGTDATGLGAYRTQIALDFQYLLPLLQTHYLRTRFIVSRNFASWVNVDGLSTFGGTVNTHGKVRVGADTSVDFAFEYTLTQNWVAVLEGNLSTGQNTRFRGIYDIDDQGNPLLDGDIGGGTFISRSLAPAIEYNFSKNVGIISGVWFAVSGRNTSRFTTYMIALNLFW
ncbi:hypothetical protein [Legionella worsleiensis]|uniref:Fe-S protein n=1 Tax=Legionella worsleiensis TaxID=45076 RepID=A0A0W1A5T1_9GAMM|nr:hypothetical protein [Legionella worsleiensis]KTD76693.1 Fe-S protein [Legionella worsleiensis]STY30457.1 Fe-S protein [Legionella worsleiensis]